MRRTVMGILAHVDSGKTTLSEAMLYSSGEIRKLGRVDHKDAFLDTHPIEQDRGITIFSHQAVMHIDDLELTLLDTPGHVDFSGETERTLQVLDYAIFVISGSAGVQSHSETLWRLLEKYSVPTFIFVNKMDLAAERKGEVLDELRRRLSGNCVDFSRTDFFEDAAMCDELLMEEFLRTDKIADEKIADCIADRKIFPCYFGSALKLDGVGDFLSGLKRYTKEKFLNDKFGAKVFKIAEDDKKERLTYMKITGGTLKVKDVIEYKGMSEKVNSIRVYSGAKFESVPEAKAGTVCAVTGLSAAYSGEGFGFERDLHEFFTEPVLTSRVVLPDGYDLHKALINFKKLEEEEPLFRVFCNKDGIHVRLMGEVQVEVLKRILSERFGMDVEFSEGSILYKETISESAEGVGHYEPLRHYAEVHLLLEPGERGSGLVFDTDCGEDQLDRNWQRLILTHLAEKVHIGVLTGSPITDIKITLVSGRAHQKHTEGGDFREATYRAVRNGLKMAKSVLLEPWYDFTLTVPEENVGRALNDISAMGAKFQPPENSTENVMIRGSAPVAEMRNYQSEVNAYTKGRGRLFCSIKGYEECHNPDEVIAEIGYDFERDVENSADSVFCSHGAGFLVKWDKVRDYMHLPGIEEKREQERVERYVRRVVSEKELAEIFERTYGPIKREIYTDAKVVRKSGTKEKSFKMKPLPKGPEYLLVDGYNIIFAWDNLKKIAEESLEAAREALIDIMCEYSGVKECELILVFDAYKVKGNHGSVEKIHNINVVYTKEAETADMYIEKVTHELGKKHKVRVATSDNLEQIIILGAGALRVSADSFKKEVDAVEKEIAEFLKGYSKNIDRVD